MAIVFHLKVTIALADGARIDQLDVWTADPAKTIAALVAKITELNQEKPA